MCIGEQSVLHTRVGNTEKPVVEYVSRNLYYILVLQYVEKCVLDICIATCREICVTCLYCNIWRNLCYILVLKCVEKCVLHICFATFGEMCVTYLY